MKDQFFTPNNIATSLVVGLTMNNIKIVADFAIGDGSLLKALPFTPKKAIGLDIDEKVLDNLKFQHPNWHLHNGDFLFPNKATASWLEKWNEKVDLILLNPPFSCRGGSYTKIQLDDETLDCRTALAFVVKSLKFLKRKGILIAILPLSILKSEKDKKVLDYLRKKWTIDYGARLDNNSFVGCSPNSVVFTLQKRTNIIQTSFQKDKHRNEVGFDIKILRGSNPIYKTSSVGIYKVLHTTNFRNGLLIEDFSNFLGIASKYVSGEFLCIPRVGLPNKGKIVVVSTKEQFVLSDCLYAIKCHDVKLLQKIILNNWEDFKDLYDSTCAPYITLNQLNGFFSNFNINCIVVNTLLETHNSDSALIR